MEEKNTNSAVETTTYEPVPAEQRRPWTSIMFIWTGSAICVPALMVGGMIGAGMKIGPAFLAMIAGFVLVCIYMILIGIQGSDLGMPTTAIFSRRLVNGAPRWLPAWLSLSVASAGSAFKRPFVAQLFALF